MKKTIHHIIPLSRQKEFKTNLNSENNLVLITDRVHRALHQLFRNKTPQEQLEMWYRINKKVMSKTTCYLLELLSEMRKDEFYKFR